MKLRYERWNHQPGLQETIRGFGDLWVTAGSSRSFPAIPASSAICRCPQVRLLSKNHPGLECSPSGASWGRVIRGVQAAAAVTPVTSSRHVYILHELFYFTIWVHSCTASALHVPPSLFTVTTMWRDILWRTLHLLNHNQNQNAVTMRPKKFVGTIRRFAKPPTDVTYVNIHHQ